MKKRERLEVINDILTVIRNNKNSLGPTKLLRYSNLSSQMFSEYMDELMQKGFVIEQIIKERKKYSLTDKGYAFIEKYQQIIGFVRDFGL